MSICGTVISRLPWPLYCRHPVLRSLNSTSRRKSLLAVSRTRLASSCREYTSTFPPSETSRSGKDPKHDAKQIFQSAVRAVIPDTLVKNALKVEGNTLHVSGRGSYHLDHNVSVVAFGKAVLGMVKAAEDILGDHIVDGVASVPFGIQETLRKRGKSGLIPSGDCAVRIHEGSKDNVPDADAHQAALEIHRLVTARTENDIVLTLFSGGGSALLPTPVPPMTLDDLSHLTRVLSKGGATIQEMNMVRKHVETLKGGGLADAAFPAQVVALILSDVIGDDLQFIASGPTVPNDSSPEDCLEVIRSLKVGPELPSKVFQVLENGKRTNGNTGASSSSEVLAAGGASFAHVENVLLGTNAMALDAASKKASSLGYVTMTLSCGMEGDADDMGQFFARMAHSVYEVLNSGEASQQLSDIINGRFSGEISAELIQLLQSAHREKKPVCLLTGGETTVKVTGRGIGGRNQQMALSSALAMLGMFPDESESPVCFLSAGTDGQDGPCPAAGAMVDPGLVTMATRQGLPPGKYLKNNDTYTFFARLDEGSYHVVTGFTGTNVMDIQVLLIIPKY